MDSALCNLPAVVWEADKGQDLLEPERLKPLSEILQLPPFPAVHRRFIEWVARYNMASRGAVLRMCLSVPDALKPPAPLVRYGISPAGAALLDPQAGDGGRKGPRLTKARRALLTVLNEGPAMRPWKRVFRLRS